MISRFCIDRPIFASVVAILMVLAGALSTLVLPVEQYPQVAPPTVRVTAAYPGADAQTVSETVAAPIEQAVNGVEDMIYMSSISADDGSYTLTVTLESGTDVDMASVRIQNRVATAEPRLPEPVRAQGVTTSKQSTSLLMVLAPHAPDGRYDRLYLSNYAGIYMVDRLARVPGVGTVTVFGAQNYAMRAWLDPQRLAARDLTTTEVIAAMRAQNVQVAAGKIGQEPAADDSGFQLTITTQGRLRTAEEFGEIILRVDEQQRKIQLKDVARIELGSQRYDSFGRFNGMQAPVIGIYQLPGSNALEVSRGVREALEELSADYPPGLKVPIFYDFTDFVGASIREVVVTLVIASTLVFVMVFVFLQDFRATLIPGAAIPVSIIGTLAVLLAMGFSVNMLTLFGLVLAIGIVVDDAIVVVENTSRLINQEGMDPKDAARRSMRQITGPIIATTLVLLAVFVPTAVLPGITGSLFRQVGVTLSIATVLSSVNALTLSPALCGVFLRERKEKPFIGFRAFNAGMDKLTDSYGWAVNKALRLWVLALIAFAGMAVGVFVLVRTTPTGFIPLEDQKYFFVNVNLPPAAKVARTDAVMAKVESRLQDTPGVAGVVSIGGFSLLTNAAEPNSGTCIVILDPWEERTTEALSIKGILAELTPRLGAIPEAIIFPFRPPAIQGLGNSGGFEIQIQDRADLGLDVLDDVAGDVVGRAKENNRLQNVFTGYSARTPQLFLDLNRTKAQELGVSLETIFTTLSGNMGSAYVNDFNAFGRTYQVRVQGEPAFRQDPGDVLLLEVRNRDGATLPLSSVADLRETVGPSTVYRYNLYPSAGISVEPARGVSTGRGMDEMESLTQSTLPSGFGYEWTGTAYQQKRAGNIAPLVFALAIVFVYLFLAAQYESWILPITIMATIPIGILGALAATVLRDLNNNIYTQIGLVLLVALVSKNAILVVEFAEQLRRGDGDNEPRSVREATIDASKLRLRPILMTAISFILGTTPLLIASGAGANSRRALGTAVFGGMVLATVVGVLFIPILYGLIRSIVSGDKPDSSSGASSDASASS